MAGDKILIQDVKTMSWRTCRETACFINQRLYQCVVNGDVRTYNAALIVEVRVKKHWREFVFWALRRTPDVDRVKTGKTSSFFTCEISLLFECLILPACAFSPPLTGCSILKCTANVYQLKDKRFLFSSLLLNNYCNCWNFSNSLDSHVSRPLYSTLVAIDNWRCSTASVMCLRRRDIRLLYVYRPV